MTRATAGMGRRTAVVCQLRIIVPNVTKIPLIRQHGVMPQDQQHNEATQVSDGEVIVAAHRVG